MNATIPPWTDCEYCSRALPFLLRRLIRSRKRTFCSVINIKSKRSIHILKLQCYSTKKIKKILLGDREPVWCLLTLLEPQSRSGDNPVKFQVVLSPNGTAVLKGLRVIRTHDDRFRSARFWWTTNTERGSGCPDRRDIYVRYAWIYMLPGVLGV